MKPKFSALSQPYEAALRKHLAQEPRASLQPGLRLGRQAVARGLETLQMARVHERALIALNLSHRNGRMLARAEHFFNETVTPIVETHHGVRQSRMDLNRLNGTLSRRTLELSTTNRQLEHGILRRKGVEAAFKKSGDHYTKLLKESLQLQEGLRRLAHEVMAAQEDECRKIGRELRDQIGQTFLGIHVRLLCLKQEARVNTKGLKNEIALTQRLVAKSAQSVCRVARRLKNA